MSEFKFLDQLNFKELRLLEKIKSDFKSETGKDFLLRIDNLQQILVHYEKTYNKIPEPEFYYRPKRLPVNFVTGNKRIAKTKVWTSDNDKNYAEKRKFIKRKIGLIEWIKRNLENELFKSSLIPVSQNEAKKDIKRKNDNYGKVQQRLLDFLKEDNIRIEESDKIASSKLNKYGLMIEKEGLTKSKKPYKNERSRISSIRKILTDIREKEKLLLKKDKT